MSTGWNHENTLFSYLRIINLLGNEYWLEHWKCHTAEPYHYKPTGK